MTLFATYPSAIGLDDTRQETQDGGLATTGFSYYRHRCGGTEIIREMRAMRCR